MRLAANTGGQPIGRRRAGSVPAGSDWLVDENIAVADFDVVAAGRISARPGFVMNRGTLRAVIRQRHQRTRIALLANRHFHSCHQTHLPQPDACRVIPAEYSDHPANPARTSASKVSQFHKPRRRKRKRGNRPAAPRNSPMPDTPAPIIPGSRAAFWSGRGAAVCGWLSPQSAGCAHGLRRTPGPLLPACACARLPARTAA